MSKRQTNQTIWSRLRRGLAALLSLALLAGLLPSAVMPAQAHWADSYVNTLVDWGVMRGDINGSMAPQRNITRAEFVAMMNRAYGYTRTAGHPFTDVSVRDWFSDDIDIAYNMGYFKGTSDTTASPNDTLTREQAAVLLSRNMMLQPTVGETLGFSDTRTLSDWSRGLVGAAAANGIISGYSNGSFQPKRNITRGEVAAMLVRAIGTPVNTPGDHLLGDVYGNVTVNTSGVKLRDGTIAGNLYLTGGIDLGDVLLENVNVLGEIIISGGGESSSSQSSVLLRNVTADKLLVDSISQQFVTIRAEGNTDIPTTTVRTNAYVDDSSLPGYGLSYIELDGAPGTLLQLAGNVKEVVNRTPDSNLQVVQGSADKITIDEDATGSTVLVDGDARVDELDLDVATKVTGEGDIKDLNVGAAGSTVEQLPDKIVIRPGIDADINGSNMNSSQAAESSADPRLEAGYPKVKNIAPTSADLVFKANKSGTIYWAVSAVTDGSVSEDDLIEPPVYGGKILHSGSISVTSSKEEYTTSLSGLTQDGSYYVSAILVDGRGNRSPVKVTAFSTPDGTVPAFNTGYPVMTMITTENAQVTVMTNKSCRLYYALLPAGSTPPTPAELKANAVRGNLGYGVRDTVKNVTQPINVNNTPLQELTNYTLYLWLTDYDGAKSSQVYALNFRTPDEQPPVIVDREQTNADANSIELTFSVNETSTLFWAIIPEGEDFEMAFEGADEEHYKPGDGEVFEGAEDDAALKALLRKLQIKIESGGGNIVKNGRKQVSAAYTSTKVTMNETRPLDAGTSSYTMYLVAKDAAGNYSKVEKINVKTRDTTPPTVKQEFTKVNDAGQPLADTDIRLVFSEGVRPGMSDTNYLELYQAVEEAVNAGDPKAEAAARSALGKALHEHIMLKDGPVGVNLNDTPWCDSCTYNPTTDKIEYANEDGWVINYCNAVVKMESGQMVVTFPTTSDSLNALRLVSGSTHHFYLNNIRDNADEANLLDPNPTELPEFIVSFAEVELSVVSHRPPVMTKAVDSAGTLFEYAVNDDGTGTYKPGSLPQNAKNENQRIDRSFRAHPMFLPDSVDPNMCYDILIWSDCNMDVTIYSRAAGSSDPWEKEGTAEFRGTVDNNSQRRFVYRSLTDIRGGMRQPECLKDMEDREYVIHVDRLNQLGDLRGEYDSWSDTVNLRVSVVAGSDTTLQELQVGVNNEDRYNEVLAKGVWSIGTPDPFRTDMTFTDRAAPEITQIRVTPSDTSPVISMTMNHPGQVNYIIFPLSDLMYKDKPTDTVQKPVLSGTPVTSVINLISSYFINEEVVVDGKTQGPPLWSDSANRGEMVEINSAIGGKGTLLTTPSRDRVVDGVFSDSSGVIKGTTNFVGAGSALRIDLTGLVQPNTIYYLCVVPQGSTPQSYASQAMGYYFTTNMAERPVLKLESTGSTNVTAIVDRTSTVQSKLLIMSGLTKHMLMEPFNKHVDTTLHSDFGAPYNAASYTVLQALFDDYTQVNPGPNGYPSVFDQFADDDTKRAVRQLISGGGVGELVKANWGPREIPVRGGATTGSGGMTYASDNLRENVDYVCLAMASITDAQGNSPDASFAFRANFPIQLMNDQAPKILSVGTDLAYDETTKRITGQIVLVFDRELYREPSGYHRLPVTQSSQSAMNGATVNGGGTHYGLGGALNGGTGVTIHDSTAVGNTNSIYLDVDKANTSDITISIPNVLCNRWGTPVTAGTVTVSYDKDNDSFSYRINPAGLRA